MKDDLLEVNFDYLQAVSFALYQNHVPIIRRLSIKNNTERIWYDLSVIIAPSEDFAEITKLHIDQMLPAEVFEPEIVQLKLNPAYINSLTEKTSSSIKVIIKKGEEEIYNENYELDLLSYDQWLGSGILPEMLSAFVTPNLPELIPIIKTASSFLDKWTGKPSLDEYQSQDPNRVKKQMAAVYAAIANLSITYCSTPASFGSFGQRIRLADTVLRTKMGNCIELSLLYASCLEAIGLHPLLILIESHAFVGAWLINDTFPDAISDDPSLLTKKTADGINEILLVESTLMAKGNVPPFDHAVLCTRDYFTDLSKFNYFIDVKRCRFSGIYPLPLRQRIGDEWKITDAKPFQAASNENGSVAPESLPSTDTAISFVSHIDLGKQQLWERKLLDLSLRNNLLNLKITKSSLQFIPVALSELEDAMAGGDEFQILPKPKDWDNPLRSTGIYQALNSEDPMLRLVKQELKQKRLRVYLPEEELHSGLISLYRSARQAMEENGANTLYLSIGLLKWYETKTSERPRFAPLLLMPVELILKSVKKGFIIRTREEETVFNITLLEKLRQDYGLSISGLDPLPTDDSGVDVKRIFNIIRQSIMSKSRWDVEEQLFLSTFSFSKFIMWNDIHLNSTQMKQNPIILGLMNGHLAEPLPSIQDENPDDKYGPADIVLPISADSSQLGAICAATENNSFILHGPPGTGKSQTITNMIANALYKRQRVLFVAEKMAALSVVQKRLSDIGLAPFCLELHSNKAKKSEVLAQLQRTSEVVKEKTPEDFKLEADRINNIRKELNHYVVALHRKQEYGYSLYDIFNQYARYPKAKAIDSFPNSLIKNLSREKLFNWIDIAENLQTVATLCGGATIEHPLYGLRIMQFSSQIKQNAEIALSEFIDIRTQLSQYIEKISDLLQLSAINWNAEKLDRLKQLIDFLMNLKNIPETFFQYEKLSELEEALQPFVENGIRQNKIKDKLLQQYQSSILSAPCSTLLKEWNLTNTKWFLPRYLGQKKMLNNLQVYIRTGNIVKEQVSDCLLNVIDFQERKALQEQNTDYLKTVLGYWWKNGFPDWNKIHDAIDAVQNLNQLILQWTGDISAAFIIRKSLGVLFREGTASFVETHGNIMQALESLIKKEQQQRLKTEQIFNVNLKLSISKDLKDNDKQRAILWKNNLDKLKDWYNWTLIRQKAIDAGLEPFIIAYEQRAIETDLLLDSFKKSLSRSLATQIIEDDPKLSSFNGLYFEAQIKKYQELAKEFTRLTQSALYAELASHIPVFSQEAATSSETGILQKAIKSNGRGLSIRKLFNLLPNLLPRMSPCMLMSPISVAQYIDINDTKFDLVIFDEASQMPTCEAVGAISRGRNLIVVGDPQQMPPSNFFSSIQIDEDNSDEDLNSILEDCQALSIPSHQLLWHYRSQHESLIAFSNARFYENNLYTFPSPDDLATRVHFIPIKGVYDRGKTRQNKVEANAIVQEIVRLLSLPEKKRKSIGVVTFSSVQQTLIEDLLNEEFAKNPTLEEVNIHSKEPLFIKNLENVQGDERDIILFSICYGPDQDDHITLAFGPLNRDGGWRRLNVAVSRARYEMKIYSSIRADQIDLNRTRSKGIAELKAFLLFAEKGVKALPIKAVGKQKENPPLETSVAEILRSHGYKVDINVGCSGYRIDMAVVDPDKPQEYMLGILFDGYNYQASQSSRDRNIIQTSILKKLGWRIFRIWAMDYWEDKKQVVQRLLSFIEQLKLAQPDRPFVGVDFVSIPKEHTETETIPVKKPVVEEIIHPDYNKAVTNDAVFVETSATVYSPDSKHRNINFYSVCNLSPVMEGASDDFLSYTSTPIITQQIKDVITAEAPIYKGLLCHRVLSAWGIGRMGNRITERFNQLFFNMHIKESLDANNVYFWREEQDPESYPIFRLPKSEKERRNAEELPPKETANAVRNILSNQISMPEEDLIRETAKLLQYARLGPNVETAMKAGILEAIRCQWVKTEKGRVIWIEK